MVKNPFEIDLGYNPLTGKSSKKKNERQPVGSSQKKDILSNQKYKCAICHKLLPKSYHFDHIKEVSRGGKSITSNLRAVCPNCHGDRHITEKAKQLDKQKIHGKKQESNLFGLPTFKAPSFKASKNPFGL